MQNVVKTDLNISPYHETQDQLLSKAWKSKRQEMGRLILEKNWHAISCLETNGKFFTFQVMHNHHNDRICAVNNEDIPLDDMLIADVPEP